MPEAPEIEALSIVLNKIGIKCIRYGKHLFMMDKCEDWHFGLVGKVKLTDTLEISKHSSAMTGYINLANNLQDIIAKHKLGVDWLNGDIKPVVEKWKGRNKTIASLMLDQSEICGIGVAWGSEICKNCGINPKSKAKDIDLEHLIKSMLFIRKKITIEYNKYILTQNLIDFVNNWFTNLYSIRTLEVYKKGIQIDIAGRTWWY
jgi:formamidopyrimidine-DNA glycosylase